MNSPHGSWLYSGKHCYTQAVIARTVLWLIVAAGLLTTPTYGNIIYLLDNPVQSGAPGDILHFTGSVTNTGPESFSGFGQTFTGIWPNAFEIIGFSPVSGFGSGPGDSLTGELFQVLITPAAVGLTVNALSYLYAWPDGSDPHDFNAVEFSNPQAIAITTVTPEPRSAELFLLGAALLACSYGKTRGASS
jgi:hypothetical protein